METLGEALTKEQARVRELLAQYKSIGPAGTFGAMMLEQNLRVADQAVMSGDVVAMLSAFSRFKECS